MSDDDLDVRLRKLEVMVAQHLASCEERHKRIAETLTRIEVSGRDTHSIVVSSSEVQGEIMRRVHDHLAYHSIRKVTWGLIGTITVSVCGVVGIIWGIVSVFL